MLHAYMVMNITLLTDQLFDSIVKKKKQILLKESDNNVPREAKTLEFQINKHLQEKYKKTERVSFTTSPLTQTNFDDLIDKEISKNRKKAKSWNNLNNCDKWKLVQEYFKNNKSALKNIHRDRDIKQLLLSNNLEVIYDKDTNSIKNIILENSSKLS